MLAGRCLDRSNLRVNRNIFAKKRNDCSYMSINF
jgi:hypothetical protein